MNTFIDYAKNIHRNDLKNKYSIIDDINEFIHTFKGDIDKFLISEKKSNLFNLLNKCSPKYIYLILNIFKTKGTVLIYSNYVIMEGLQILKIYLNFFGFISIDLDDTFNKKKLNDDNLKKDNFRFCEFHGDIDKDTRYINKEIFNNPKNKYGKYCKIILISAAGSVGINLSNIRQVHIVEPYWNEVRIDQVIGRAVRFCQHKDLPMSERIVDIFRYKMIRTNGKITADEKIETLARTKYNLLDSFINAVKESAIDCQLFQNHNMMDNKYKCFQFNENSLFERPIGPAYNNKLEYDMKMNNGLNSIDSNIQKIKVIKIKGVFKNNDNIFSEENHYWFYPESGVVYDYTLLYPIGKIYKNNNNIYQMLSENIYIISEKINIPKFKIYD